MKKLQSKIKWSLLKFKSRPHFWIKPIYSDSLIQGIHFPNGMVISKPGASVKQCIIGGDFHDNTWKP